MNQLSWLLYAADVAGGLGGLTAFLAIVSGVSFCIAGCFRIGIFVQELDYGRKAPDGLTTLVSKTQKWTAAVCGLTALVTVLTPSKETLYAIAASELGERVIASPTADKAMQALNHWLDEQISGDEDGTEPEETKGE